MSRSPGHVERALRAQRHQFNIYRRKGEWCYALFIDGQFDSSDTIGCDDSYDEADARAALTAGFSANPLTIVRVPDVR